MPSSEELALLEPFRPNLPKEVFGEPVMPPVSDGSGQDRQLLRRADELLREAGCKREGAVLKLPNGQPFMIEFLDFQTALQPHTQPFQANLKKLGIEPRSRIVDAAQYQRRMDEYDFDMSSRALERRRNAWRQPARRLWIAGRKGSGKPQHRGNRRPGSRCPGRADRQSPKPARSSCSPAARWTGCCAQAAIGSPCGSRAMTGWPIGTNSSVPRPSRKLDSGAPGTWWHDPEKAKRIGRA